MIFAPYLFKSKALRALRGNWQTALLVCFCASLPTTLMQLLQVRLPNVATALSVEALIAAVQAVPDSTWTLLYLSMALVVLLTPPLAIGCNHYFISRLHGKEPGFGGLFAGMRIYLKSLWLFVLTSVKIFLWSLLLIVPGIIAALRYSMAQYYLAEDPTLSAGEAIEKSKAAMANVKLSYFVLQLSFIPWSLASVLVELLLIDLSPILALVAAQFISLFVATYMNGACAAFYLAVSEAGGMEKAQEEANRLLRRGMGQSGPWNRPDDGSDATDDSDGDSPDDE